MHVVCGHGTSETCIVNNLSMVSITVVHTHCSPGLTPQMICPHPMLGEQVLLVCLILAEFFCQSLALAARSLTELGAAVQFHLRHRRSWVWNSASFSSSHLLNLTQAPPVLWEALKAACYWVCLGCCQHLVMHSSCPCLVRGHQTLLVHESMRSVRLLTVICMFSASIW